MNAHAHAPTEHSVGLFFYAKPYRDTKPQQLSSLVALL